MKTQEIYQVDAFADGLFQGNPAGVCILDEWLPEEMMQSIAAENNLSETAFAVPVKDSYEIRWFTPENEVALCGHATLATAHVLFETREKEAQELRFQSMERGALRVYRNDPWLELDFPSEYPRDSDMPDRLAEAIGGAYPEEVYSGMTDYMLVYPDQESIDALDPDHTILSKVDCRGVIVTAPGKEADFVSRFFAPRCGVPEDPVTGSAHTMLIPYWSERLGKTKLMAEQRSRRGGLLRCEDRDERVRIAGKAITYLKGEIYIPTA